MTARRERAGRHSPADGSDPDPGRPHSAAAPEPGRPPLPPAAPPPPEEEEEEELGKVRRAVMVSAAAPEPGRPPLPPAAPPLPEEEEEELGKVRRPAMTARRERAGRHSPADGPDPDPGRPHSAAAPEPAPHVVMQGKSDRMVEDLLGHIKDVKNFISQPHTWKLNSQTVEQLKNTIHEVVSIEVVLQTQHANLQNSFAYLQKIIKEDVLRILEDEERARAYIEYSRGQLLENVKRVKSEDEALTDQIKILQLEIESLQDLNRRLQEYSTTLQQYSTKNSDSSKISSLEEICAIQNKTIKNLEIELAEKSKRLDLTLLEYDREKINSKNLQTRLGEAENLRKILMNKIIDLKGKVRVFCRVRPIMPSETGALSYPKSGENVAKGINLTQNGQTHSFVFDQVFKPSASQKEVFEQISELVQSAMDGYRVCIFAYGQTGSGKTFTMMGHPESDDKKGLIPRSLEQIFKTRDNLNLEGWEFKIEASVLEIYNESINDLLAQDGAASKCSIKEASGNPYVSDLTVVDASSLKEVSSHLKRATRKRCVGSTLMNVESSRSHLVFTLKIFGAKEDQQFEGVLNLIDLAGSERIDKSGATGVRLQESIAINKSLSALSNTISAIANKDKHVPFRESNLTHLLKPCLEGSSKVLMFVNLSPEVSSSGESLSSLRFAERVNCCETAMPRREIQQRSSQEELPPYSKLPAELTSFPPQLPRQPELLLESPMYLGQPQE